MQFVVCCFVDKHYRLRCLHGMVVQGNDTPINKNDKYTLYMRLAFFEVKRQTRRNFLTAFNRGFASHALQIDHSFTRTMNSYEEEVGLQRVPELELQQVLTAPALLEVREPLRSNIRDYMIAAASQLVTPRTRRHLSLAQPIMRPMRRSAATRT